jgi:multidrug efflux pump subunit AcrB
MASFFIRRPIVAIVIAMLTVIVGAITIALLPIAQFPNIAPPEIWLQANYPGADAKTLEQSVATPIEQQVTGVDNMEYMYSVNTTNGSQTSLIVDFDLKTDPSLPRRSTSLWTEARPRAVARSRVLLPANRSERARTSFRLACRFSKTQRVS